MANHAPPSTWYLEVPTSRACSRITRGKPCAPKYQVLGGTNLRGRVGSLAANPKYQVLGGTNPRGRVGSLVANHAYLELGGTSRACRITHGEPSVHPTGGRPRFIHRAPTKQADVPKDAALHRHTRQATMQATAAIGAATALGTHPSPRDAPATLPRATRATTRPIRGHEAHAPVPPDPRADAEGPCRQVVA